MDCMCTARGNKCMYHANLKRMLIGLCDYLPCVGDEIRIYERNWGKLEVIATRAIVRQYTTTTIVFTNKEHYGDFELDRGRPFTSIEILHNNKPNKASEPTKLMEGLKSMFTNLFTNEPEKSFKKAGIIRDGGFLTEDGAAIFLAYLLKTNAEDFKTAVVDEIIKQMEVKK